MFYISQSKMTQKQYDQLFTIAMTEIDAINNKLTAILQEMQATNPTPPTEDTPYDFDQIVLANDQLLDAKETIIALISPF